MEETVPPLDKLVVDYEDKLEALKGPDRPSWEAVLATYEAEAAYLSVLVKDWKEKGIKGGAFAAIQVALARVESHKDNLKSMLEDEAQGIRPTFASKVGLGRDLSIHADILEKMSPDENFDVSGLRDLAIELFSGKGI